VVEKILWEILKRILFFEDGGNALKEWLDEIKE
jgi:hypothetical protein